MRGRFYQLIDSEIENALAGKKAEIILKLNNLEDRKIINKLYKASLAGVKITIIVRSVCCLIPGIKNLSENISAYSIVDRFLEHTRIYIFHNRGRQKIYLASADWMTRNLDRRIEIAFPINSEPLKNEIRTLVEFQLQDNTKVRIIDKKLTNTYLKSGSDEQFNAQLATYNYFKASNGV